MDHTAAMRTAKEVAEAISAELGQVAAIRTRPMMGGWLVYADEVLVGQINEGELFLKRSGFADGFAPELEHRPPYDGARPALVVPRDRLDDQEWLRDLLAGSVAALRKPPAR
jgi:TfoX/Sxy family transcriptional regulator of competence genes